MAVGDAGAGAAPHVEVQKPASPPAGDSLGAKIVGELKSIFGGGDSATPKNDASPAVPKPDAPNPPNPQGPPEADTKGLKPTMPPETNPVTGMVTDTFQKPDGTTVKKTYNDRADEQKRDDPNTKPMGIQVLKQVPGHPELPPQEVYKLNRTQAGETTETTITPDPTKSPNDWNRHVEKRDPSGKPEEISDEREGGFFYSRTTYNKDGSVTTEKKDNGSTAKRTERPDGSFEQGTTYNGGPGTPSTQKIINDGQGHESISTQKFDGGPWVTVRGTGSPGHWTNVSTETTMNPPKNPTETPPGPILQKPAPGGDLDNPQGMPKPIAVPRTPQHRVDITPDQNRPASIQDGQLVVTPLFPAAEQPIKPPEQPIKPPETKGPEQKTQSGQSPPEPDSLQKWMNQKPTAQPYDPSQHTIMENIDHEREAARAKEPYDPYAHPIWENIAHDKAQTKK